MQWIAMARYPVDIRRARLILRRKAAASVNLSGRPIALVMRTSKMLVDGGRHLATIAHHVIESGSPFHFVCDDWTLAAIAHKSHGRTMLAMNGTTRATSENELPTDTLVLADESDPTSTIQLKIGRDIDRTIPVMPYPMHPATLGHIDGSTYSILRNRTRRIDVLFAGNQKRRYGDAKIGRNFGILNRVDVLDTIRESLGDRVVDRFTGAKQDDSILLSDSRVDPVAASDWLPAVASANFFLCCPGSSQPTCHHLSEAMSVGTIPILEYGDRVTPELTDGVNAICFSGRVGLINAIERIDSMTDQEIASMRYRVGQFFDEHLCLTTFMSKLRDGKLDLSSQQICLPFHDENLYESINRDQSAGVAIEQAA